MKKVEVNTNKKLKEAERSAKILANMYSNISTGFRRLENINRAQNRLNKASKDVKNRRKVLTNKVASAKILLNAMNIGYRRYDNKNRAQNKYNKALKNLENFNKK